MQAGNALQLGTGEKAKRFPFVRRLRETAGACGFLLPNLLGFLAFTLGPVVASLLLSFCKWDLISGPGGISWVGLANYREILHDHDFWYYVYNTLYFMLVIPAAMIGSLVLAILLNQRLPGTTLFRTVFFLPSMCVPVAVFLLWKWMLNTDVGLINRALGAVGIEGPNWLHAPAWARPALMLAGLWMSVGGGNMILYLAGLQGVPRELYEAAELDGAAPLQKFLAITWPMLHPTTFFIFITSLIGGFQGNFEGPYMMTRGGPAGATTTISYYIYNNAFDYFRMGYAAALAWALFLVILIVTLLNWRYIEGKIGYH
jgi:multiple sugar transport system permease protein